MAVKSINMKKEVARGIHFPRTKNSDIPAYKRVATYIDTSDSAYMQLKNDAEAMDLVSKRYNSPNNVKSVVIGVDGVYVSMFHGYKTNKGNGNWQSSIKSNTHKFDDVAYCTDYMNGTKKNVGNVIKNIAEPNLCSNIEEIYIDASAIYTDYTLSRGYAGEIDNLVKSGISRIYNNETGEVETSTLGSGGVLKISRSDLPKKILIDALGIDEEKLSKQYSRLHTIAITDSLSFESVKNTPETGYKKPSAFYWKDNFNSVVDCNMIMSFDPSVLKNLEYRELTVRPGIYAYDADVLVGHNESLAEKVKNLEKSAYDAIIKKNEETLSNSDGNGAGLGGADEKSELEIALDTHFEEMKAAGEKAPLKKIQEMLYLLSRDRSKEEVNEMFNEMSQTGNKKYKALLIK